MSIKLIGRTEEQQILKRAYETNEAKVAKAIDKLEAQIQHQQADLSTWKEIEFDLTFMLQQYTDFDEALEELRVLIVKRAEAKYTKFGKDPIKIKRRLNI